MADTQEGREEFLAGLRKRFEWSQDASKDWRKQANSDMEFLTGDQWDERNIRTRSKDGRPCLTINRLGQLTRLVSNETSRAKPGMFAHPVDSHADVAKAEVIMGIIRHIERINDSTSCYGTATDNQIRCGIGYFGFQTRYSRKDSFDQELSLRYFPNPLAIYGDPSSVELDGSDSDFYFVTERVSKEEYRERWPESKATTSGFSSVLTGGWDSWVSENLIQVAEYWYVTRKHRDLVRLKTGEARWKKELLAEGHTAEQITDMSDATRQVEDRTVHRAVTNGYEVLEEDEWPGAWIPIFPVYGEVIWVKGKKVIRGLIPDAKEPQRVLNYTFSGAMEMIALAPKAPYIAAEGQVDPDDDSWLNSNVAAPAVLLYKPVVLTTAEGDSVIPGPPQRQFAEPPIQALVGMMSLAEDGIRHSVGLHAPSIGALSAERSGKAIKSLQDKGSMSTYHFVLNFARSIRFAVKQLIGDGQDPGLIQMIYNEPGRILRIIGDDDEEKMVVLGKSEKDLPDQKLKEQPDFAGIHDLSMGLFDVSADVGHAFSTQREAAFEALGQVLQSQPDLMKLFGDIWMKNADFPGSQEIAKRIKNVIDPQALGEKPEIPPEVKQQLMQAEQQMKGLAQELEEKNGIIDAKQVENTSKENIAKFEAISKERIAGIQASFEGLKIMVEAYAAEGDQVSTEELEQIKGSYGVMVESIKTLGKDRPVGSTPKPTPTPTPKQGATP